MIGIINREYINDFLLQIVRAGHTATSIKGNPPKGMTYNDGGLVVNQVNIGWKCKETGEYITILYGEYDE